MASKNFQERFKNKVSSISADGIFEINPDRIASKPSGSQLHSTVIRSSAHQIINPMVSPIPKSYLHYSSDNSFYGSASVAYTDPVSSVQPNGFHENHNIPPKKVHHQSAAPMRTKDGYSTHNKELANRSHQSFIDFKPYTLKDYQVIKPKNYYELGGLGPSSIGTQEWAKKKEMIDKRIKYGKEIYFYNAAKLPLLPPVSPVKAVHIEEDLRQKAISFAKKIPRPPLKTKVSFNN